MLHDPTFWVAIAFVVFVALVVWKAGSSITGALDARADKIKDDLDEAEKLRSEAQDLLADYQKRQREAAKEAEIIVAEAKAEAERMLTSGKARMEEQLKRREKLAMDRIAQAESNATAEVKAHAVEIAISAARDVLAENATGATANRLIDEAVKALPGKLH